MKKARNLLAIIVIELLIAIIALGANPFKKETVAPMDLLNKYKGWSTVSTSSKITHHERSDVLDAILPAWIAMKKDLRNGQIPLWIDTVSGGMPGIQLLTNSGLTPSFLAFALTEDDAFGFYLAQLIKLFFAGLGMYFFLNLFLRPLSSIFGSAIFMLSGFHAAWLFWPHVSTSMWIPWCLFGLCHWYINSSKAGLLTLSISFTLMLLGGFPSVAVFGFYSLVLTQLVLMLSNRKDGRLINNIFGLIVTAIATLIICAIPLAFLIQFLNQFDLSYRGGGTALKSIEDFLLFFIPYQQDDPRVEKTFYVGKLATIFTIFSFLLLFSKKERENLLFRVGMVLFLFSFVISFGLAPHSWIQSIPALGSNLWSRIVIILGLSMSILASFLFDKVAKSASSYNRYHAYRPLAYLMVFGLFLFQFIDQKDLLNKFNASVANSSFYPLTPSIKFMQDNLKPMESVIADRSFIISGVLAAYGIPEWFAHGFKTNNEKRILGQLVSKPFVSPTAASFELNQINPQTNLFELLGIKYLIGSGNPESLHYIKIRERKAQTSHYPSPTLPNNKISQSIKVDSPITLDAMSVRVATYGAIFAPFDIQLKIFDPIANRIIATAFAPKETITDNSWAFFPFESEVKLYSQNYLFEFSSTSEKQDGKISLWLSNELFKSHHYALVNEEEQQTSIQYRLFVKRQEEFPHSWKQHKLEPNIVIFENEKNTSGALFTRKLNSKNSQFDRNLVYTKKISNLEYHINYMGKEQGYLVIPKRIFPGWEMWLNGIRVKPETFEKILPAIYVNGPSNLVVSYQPFKNLLDYFSQFQDITKLGPEKNPRSSEIISRRKERQDSFSPK